MCFLQIFGTKTKAKKKPHFQNIEYNGIEICTRVRCFAFNLLSNCCWQHLKHNYQLKYVSGRLVQYWTLLYKTWSMRGKSK